MTDETNNSLGSESNVDSSSADTDSGLDENAAGALCYVLGFVTGLIFYFTEEKNKFVRFHAVQSTIVFGGLFILGIVLGIFTTIMGFIPIIGWAIAAILGIVSLLLPLAGIILWILLIYKAYQGEKFALPLIGAYAEQYSAPQK